jgi:hypothetical protein
MIKKNKDLIIITLDGVTHKLWGLVICVRDKRNRWQVDQDYIGSFLKQAKSSDQKKARDACDALIYLNAFILATLDCNMKPLHDLGIDPKDETKKSIYNASNATKRCFVNNNQGSECPVFEDTKGSTIGELVEGTRKLKTKLAKNKQSIKDHRAKAVTKKASPLPVKTYTAEEFKKLKK